MWNGWATPRLLFHSVHRLVDDHALARARRVVLGLVEPELRARQVALIDHLVEDVVPVSYEAIDVASRQERVVSRGLVAIAAGRDPSPARRLQHDFRCCPRR